MIFNPSLVRFVVACLFSLETLSIGFPSWLGLCHEAPSIIFMTVEWPTSPRGHPAFSPLRQLGCQ